MAFDLQLLSTSLWLLEIAWSSSSRSYKRSGSTSVWVCWLSVLRFGVVKKKDGSIDGHGWAESQT